MISDKAIMLAIAVLCATTLPANAQNQTSTGAQQKKKTEAAYDVDIKEVKVGKGTFQNTWAQNNEILAKPIQIPGVPGFTGQNKFMYGAMKRGQGGVVVNMRFSAKATPEAIINFYRDGLKQYGWSVSPKQEPDRQISAVNKNQETFTVDIFPGGMEPGTTDFYISAMMKH